VVKQDFCVWVSGAPASVAGSIARAVELALAGIDGQVVLATGRPPADGADTGRVVEVFVGDAAPTGGGAAPDVVVSGDGARAGESARHVLRYLAEAGYSDPLDDYSDDDEAAVSVRLQAFGYL
jgi:hypothetical protein